MATVRSADAHDAGFQAVEWPQEGRLMLTMLAFSKGFRGHKTLWFVVSRSAPYSSRKSNTLIQA